MNVQMHDKHGVGNLPTLTFVSEQNDSNAVLPLPEERLEDMWLSLPQHDGGVIARRPPTAPQKNMKQKYDISKKTPNSLLFIGRQDDIACYH